MHSFWKWLMRADARLIFLSAAIGLCIVIIFWLWKLYTPVQSPLFRHSSPKGPQTSSSIGILVMVDELESHVVEPPQKFFLAPEPQKAIVVRPQMQTQPQPQPQPQPQQPQPQPQPQPPKRNIVNLVYRGLFQPPDGRKLALIEDVTTGRQTFLSISNQIQGLTITSFDHKSVSVTFADGSSGVLEFGKPLSIEGGRRAD